MSIAFRAFALSIAAVSSTLAAATPIYVKAGQCVYIGNQEVCALPAGDATDPAAAAAKPQILHTCRYGMHPGAEVSDVKTYALFQLVIQPGGAKSETLLRNYGLSAPDKQACEGAADKLNADQKKP